ncbi:hypothetical protein BX666DRAFT_1907337 [Dichotomocladium elegans]|nr:hypothetical protein BX666DRAFT_2006990 [Dichotomocladium elegans]KAI9320383.1 hypothetical protein BX666DRAFT_1907337 [Dichotomocladium elegans]
MEKYILCGVPMAEAAKSANMAVSTFSDHVARYQLEQESPKKRGPKAKAPFSKAMVRVILEYVDTHPVCAVDDVLSHCMEEDVDGLPSRVALQRWLQKNARFTFQRMKSFNVEPSIEAAHEHERQFNRLSARAEFEPDKNVVFVAEVAFLVNGRRTYPARSTESSSQTADVGDKKPHVCLLIAFDHTGIVTTASKSLEGRVTKDEFIQFVADIVAILDAEKRKDLFLGFDPLPAEVAAPVFQKAKEKGHTPFIFPAQVLAWNPAEYLVRDLLLCCNRQLSSGKRQSAEDRFDAVFETISPSKCQDYIFLAFPSASD